MNCIPNRLVLLALVISSSLAANIINVPADYSTIQVALTAAGSSDTVLVQPGTYPENIIWPDVNGIKLLSAGDSSNTIIDGGANGSVIHMNPSSATIDSTTEIRGFKITNGGNIANGGGMLVGNASPVLNQLSFTRNTVSSNGGGLYITGGSPMLTKITVTGNTASKGGGIYIDSASPVLTEVTVTGNSHGGLYINYSSPTMSYLMVTDNSGSGLYIEGGSPTLTDVTVTGNTGSGLSISYSSPKLTDVTVTGNTGGGLSIYEGSPTLTNVTVTGNTAGSGVVIGGGGGLFIEAGSPMLTDVTVAGNTAVSGGGLYMLYASPTLVNVTVTGNSASYGGGLYISYGSPTLMNVTVTANTANYGGGLYITSGNPTMVNVTITGNTSGIYIYNGTPSISGSNIAYNGTGVYNLDNSNTIDADSVWWGHSSGPYHPQKNPGGLGDSVNAFVDITPWLTEPDTPAPPIPVQNLVVTNQGDDFVELAWDASPIGDLAGYRVYYDTDSSGFPYSDTVDVGAATLYTLSGLPLSTTVYLAVTCYDTDGSEGWYSDEVSAVTILGVSRKYETPYAYALHPGYPNPFNPSITLTFDLPERAPVFLAIYDLMGREVVRLADGAMIAGYHLVVWNGKGTNGRTLPTGIYIARLTTPEYAKSIKMLLLK